MLLAVYMWGDPLLMPLSVHCRAGIAADSRHKILRQGIEINVFGTAMHQLLNSTGCSTADMFLGQTIQFSENVAWQPSRP